MDPGLWKKAATKAVLALGIAGLGSIVFYEDSWSNKVPVMGWRVPSPLAIGGAVAGASVAADVAHVYVLPHIPGNAKWNNIETMVLGVSVSGFSTIFLLKSIGGSGMEWESFMLGAGSYAAADWLEAKFMGSISVF